MKIAIFLLFFLQALFARENPFAQTYVAPKVKDDIIPLLHITTNKVFEQPKQIVKQPLIIVENETNSTIPIKETTTPLAVPIIIEKKPAQIKTIKPQKIKKIIKTTKRIKKKTSTKKIKYRTIYQNYFLKVQTNDRSFKIFTHDILLDKVRFSNPPRMTFDFDRLQYFHTKNITFNKPFAKMIKFGSHHDFYRITVKLGKYKNYKLTKKPYGYLLSFY